MEGVGILRMRVGLDLGVEDECVCIYWLVLFDASILYRKESVCYDEAGVEGLWVLESDCVLCKMVQRGTFRTSQKSLLSSGSYSWH